MSSRLGAFILLALSALGGISTACSAMSSKPTIVIQSPPHGSQFQHGDNVAVQSVATDPTGISRVELAVDGAIVRSDAPLGGRQSTFPVVQNWTATQGTHTLAVRAYNTAGLVSEPMAVSISVAAAGAPTGIPALPAATLPAATLPAVTLPPPPPPAPPSSTPSPTVPPPTVACTNLPTFVADVTVPPGTLLAANQGFNKIWRIRNDGTCAWDSNYQFIFVGGEPMAPINVIAVPNTAPGATADLLIPMTAPATPGIHSSEWQMYKSGGLLGTPLSVSINVISNVPAPAPGCAGAPTIDFFTASPSTINAGQSTTLMWGKVENATSAIIDQGIGGVATPGSATVSPATTTTYTMSASGCGGTVTKQTTVTVGGAAGIQPPGPVVTSVQPIFPILPVVPVFPMLQTGNLTLQEIILSTGNEVILRVALSSGSLSGSFNYSLSVNGSQVKQGSFTIPTGSQAFWTGYIVNGTVTVKGSLNISDSNQGDNEKTVTCSSASHTCW